MYLSAPKNMPIVALLACFILLGCSKSDDQKEFENQAYSQPDNITEMPSNPAQGVISEDPDDWRISPMYQGLIEVSTPAYPNPVSLNSDLRLEINFKYLDSVPGFEINVLQNANSRWPIIEYDQSELSLGVRTFVLDPSSFSGTSSSQNAAGLNRLIIFDGQDNVITYGDVRVK